MPQKLEVLRLNYLIGLCYPSFTSDNRMVAPFINLTIGDMFKDTPGFLDSLSVEVDDTGTWEIEDGLQSFCISSGKTFLFVIKFGSPM